MNHQQPQPPPGTITFQELLNLHAHLRSLKDPSPAITACITQLESHIQTFVFALSTNQGTRQ